MSTHPPPLRILVVDDHPVVCGGLEAMLSSLARVAIATDGQEALRLCASFEPHLVLLDLRMPGLDGYATLALILQRWPHIRVIMLTGTEHAAEAVLARQAGAAGFVRKFDSPSNLLGAIRKVAAGGIHFPSPGSRKPEQPAEVLTTRELEVLRHLARGLTNEEIGQAIGAAAQTVKGHLKHLFPKLHAANRAEAVTRAHELRLL